MRDGVVEEESVTRHVIVKGTIWVLEPEMVPKISTNESPPRVPEAQKNKGIVEVFPVKKYATIKGHSLVMTDVDGSQVTVELQNCTIVAVSASSLSSRKWAKRYPIRLESKNSLLYNGSNTCYLFLDTSWEKESWCKALRLASCLDKEKLTWYAQLSEEFHNYLSSLNAKYPSFLKPSTVFVEDASDRSNKVDVSSSKVRHLLKKLGKKASKTTSVSASTHNERKSGEKIHSSQDTSMTDGSVKSSQESRASSDYFLDLLRPTSPTSNDWGNKSEDSLFPDISEKFADDEGTLCWNLLLARLFFDVKRNIKINNAILARFQRTLLNMRTPSYIRGIKCTSLDLGNLPPYIHKMRVLPMDLNEAWVVEVDIEYSGGLLLEFATRIEVSEPGLQEDIINTSFEPSSAERLTSDLLEGIEHYGNQLKSSTHSANIVENKDEVDKVDGLKQSKSSSWKSSYVSRWKAIKKSFTDQVSQVPLSLSVRVASLRGTLRLHMKPPPSDHIWYGFTSMPEIDWNLDSSIGDRKITNAHIALLIGNRFKAAIRETVVLPNCESICIPFMEAEKDDWVPRANAPFIRLNHEVLDKSGSNSFSSHNGEAKLKHTDSNGIKVDPADKADNKEIVKKLTSVQEQNSELVNTTPPSVSSDESSCMGVMDDRGITLSRSEERKVEPPGTSTSRALVTREGHPTLPSEDDLKAVKSGSRRARMLDIGKKMGEKLEEKRRHIEEKSRNLVEKMRENSKN